jgi:hypothetical protein
MLRKVYPWIQHLRYENNVRQDHARIILQNPLTVCMRKKSCVRLYQYRDVQIAIFYLLTFKIKSIFLVTWLYFDCSFYWYRSIDCSFYIGVRYLTTVNVLVR